MDEGYNYKISRALGEAYLRLGMPGRINQI